MPGRGKSGVIRPEVQDGWIGRETECTPPQPLETDTRPPAGRVAVISNTSRRGAPLVGSTRGARSFDPKLFAVSKSHLVWFRTADVVVVSGPLAGVDSYRIFASRLLQAAWKLDTSLDRPGRSQGLYYLVRYADGGSWQTSGGRTPERDTTLP